jgi:sister-chromatid-cohesion protein PDS5
MIGVFSHLEEELRLDNLKIRTLATKTLASIFAGENGTLVINKYNTLWRAFLDRNQDADGAIRMLWVERAFEIYKKHHTLSSQLNKPFTARLADPDDKIRLCMCEQIADLDYSSLLMMDEDMLKEFLRKSRDKKVTVRIKSFGFISKVFMALIEDLMDRAHDTELDKFRLIPDYVFRGVRATDESVRKTSVMYIEECIFPIDVLNVDDSLDLKKNADSQYTLNKNLSINKGVSKGFSVQYSTYINFVYKCLSEDGRVAFSEWLSCKSNFNTRVLYALQLYSMTDKVSRDQKEAVANEIAVQIKTAISSLYEPEKLYIALNRFMEDRSNRDFLQKICQEGDAKTTIGAYYSQLRRLFTQKSLVQPLKSCILFFSRLTIHPAVFTPEMLQNESYLPLIQTIAVSFPSLLKCRIGTLLDSLDKDLPIKVRMCSMLLQTHTEVIEYDCEKVRDILMENIIDNEADIKHYVAIITKLRNNEGAITLLLDRIADCLDVMDFESIKDPKLISYLILLKYLFKSNNNTVMAAVKENEILQHFVTLSTNGFLKNGADESLVKKWRNENDLPLIVQAQLLTMKALTYYRIMLNDAQELKDFCVYLEELIEKEAESVVASQMKLMAFRCYLKVLRDADRLIPIEKFVFVAQDMFYPVREAFYNKLYKSLIKDKIPKSYSSLLFLAALDPESNLVKAVRKEM